MGFLVQSGQITPEVAQNAFHFWIEGYYLATKEYVRTKRQERPVQWEFVEDLYKLTSEVERERARQASPKAPVNEGPDQAAYVAKFLNGESELKTRD